MPNEKVYTLFVLYHIVFFADSSHFAFFKRKQSGIIIKKYENEDIKIRSAKGETGLANH